MIHPQKILTAHGFSALKSFGQNFLTSDHHLRKFPSFLEGHKNILEIGPGLGAITSFLMEQNFQVTVCEIDRGLSAYIADNVQPCAVVTADFLQVPVSEWEARGITAIVSNLPFYITSPIITKIISDMPFIKKCIWGMQLEVAQRLLSDGQSSLAVFVNASGKTEKIDKIPRNAFYPVPEVDAMFVGWSRIDADFILSELELLLRASFWGKRKSLANCLRKNPFFENHEIGREWLRKLAVLHALPETKEKSSEEAEHLIRLFSRRADDLSCQEFILLLKLLNSLHL